MATRVPVPEDYESDVVVMAGTDDDIPSPDVELADRDHARDLHVRRDDDGRYVGCDAAAASAVRAVFGGADGEDTDTVPVEDAIDQGVCPWCDGYTGDAVPQHASSAHADEWAAYKEADA